MVEWIYVNTAQIKKIAYNSEIKTMYIDFCGSTEDTPFKNVTKRTFQEFSQASNVDKYYEDQIKINCERIDINTENNINFKSK